MTPIQFGHITIAGTKYPVKFGMAQNRAYCKRLNVEQKDYLSLFTPDKDGTNKLQRLETNGDEMVTLVYTALEQGYRVEGKEFTLSEEDVCDLIDHMNREPDLFKQFFAIANDGADLIPNANGASKAPAKKVAPLN